MRDYKKEAAKRKESTKRLVVDVEKELADEFLTKLDKPYATWVKEQIKKFLQKI